MGTIRNNGSAYVANYMLGNKLKSLTLFNGFNLNIPDEDVDAMLAHEIIKKAYENETLEVIIRDPVKTSELEGFQVVESKRTGEPLPVFDEPKFTFAPDAPKPEERLPVLTQAQLKDFPGIGDGYAAKILSRQPEGGYESFSQLKGLNSDLTKLKEENWTEIQERVKG
jgi:hypothetical protein